jgi:hypothetical protein
VAANDVALEHWVPPFTKHHSLPFELQD